MIHPAPETLLPLALGAADPTTARHVESCATCRADVARLREAAELLRGPASLERWTLTPECLEELTIADFVDGRLTPEARAPVVRHLLTCARCRSVVKATGRLIADTGVAAGAPERRWRRWPLPLGLAAAAALLLFLWPRSVGERGPAAGMREPTLSSTVAPVPIVPPPGASVSRVGRLVWSSVPRAERYRVRLYGEGSVVWTAETADTAVALPDSIVLSPRVSYFWRVEAQTEWRRWVASDLVMFRLIGPRR